MIPEPGVPPERHIASVSAYAPYVMSVWILNPSICTASAATVAAAIAAYSNCDGYGCR